VRTCVLCASRTVLCEFEQHVSLILVAMLVIRSMFERFEVVLSMFGIGPIEH